MLSERRVDTLRPGNVFRDWLAGILGDRIRDKRCQVAVYKIGSASHTVCRYEFVDQGLSVVAKFYAEPTGWLRDYDPVRSMHKEYEMLNRVGRFLNIPRPLAINEEFHCVLVTEYVRGKPLYKYLKKENHLYDKLTAVAHALRSLHDNTKSDYRKQDEFARFHKVLDQLRLNSHNRLRFNRLLGDWWYSTLIDQPYGCIIHNDANPVNYVFDKDQIYVLDFESSWQHANFVHDLGTVAAELKHYFAVKKRDPQEAEPYIGHFLWNYSHDLEEFRKITSALPFFMSLGLLRMARLNLSLHHRQYILNEALACLEAIKRI